MTNSKFEDLEKRAKRLAFKSSLKYILLVAFVFIAFFASFVFLQKETKVVQVPKAEIVEVKKEHKKEEAPQVLQVVKQESKESIKEDINESNATYDTVTLVLSLPQKNLHVTSDLVKNNRLKKETIEMPKELQEPEKKTFRLEVTDTNKEEVLLRNFSSSKTFNNALALCNLYFEKSSYLKAIFWAKEASRIKPESATPWIIYAKAKNRLGQKSEAIKALENYLSFFSSKAAAELLFSLKGSKK
jgi:predicted Zn-dependent protease